MNLQVAAPAVVIEKVAVNYFTAVMLLSWNTCYGDGRRRVFFESPAMRPEILRSLSSLCFESVSHNSMNASEE